MERISRNAPALLLAAALGTGIAMTLVLTSETTFFQDTWAFLIDRREVTPDALFEPHNEHLVVFPVLIEMLLVRVFGMTSAASGLGRRSSPRSSSFASARLGRF